MTTLAEIKCLLQDVLVELRIVRDGLDFLRAELECSDGEDTEDLSTGVSDLVSRPMSKAFAAPPTEHK